MLNIFPNPEGVKCLNQAIYRDIQVLRTWESIFIAPVDCIYGYSHSTLSALLENELLVIPHSYQENSKLKINKLLLLAAEIEHCAN